MQSCPAPRRRRARAALSLAFVAVALTAYLILLAPAQAAPHSGSITSSYVKRGPLGEGYGQIVVGPAGVYAVGNTHVHNMDVLVSRNTFANRNLGQFTWSNPNNMNGVDLVNAAVGDRFGNVLIAGSTESRDYYGDWDLVVLKVSPRMELQWSVVLDGGDQLSDHGQDIACDRAGNVYVTGMRGTAQGDDFWTMKLAAKTGAIMWQTLYDAGLDDAADSLCLDERGNVYVAGYSENAEADKAAHGRSDLVTVKYDRHGTQQWATRTDSPLHDTDSPRYIALGRSGALFVAGEAWDTTGTLQQHFWLVRLTTDGRERWQRILDGAPWKDTAWAFKVGPDNSAYIAGDGYQITADPPYTFSYRGLVARWNSSGKLLWARETIPPAGGRIEVRDLVVDERGNSWSAGYQRLPGKDNDALVVKYNSRGRELWTSAWDDPTDHDEMFFGLALVGAHSVFAAGDGTAPAGDYDAALIGFRR